MAGTRSSARQAAQNSSSPQSAKASNGTKRKADDASSPTANSKSKRGRPSKAQATLEETMPDADGEETNESAPQKQSTKGDGSHDAKENGDEEGRFERPEGCWGWFDADHVSSTETANGKKGDDEKHGGVTMEHGEPFKGKNADGEHKSDPEKALKDSRGAGGANALDKVQADEDDAGKTSKV